MNKFANVNLYRSVMSALGLAASLVATSGVFAQSKFELLLEDTAVGQNAPIPPAGAFTSNPNISPGNMK